MIPHLDLRQVNAPYMEELQRAVCEVVASGVYIGGPEVKALEEDVARLCATPFAVGTANGLDALRLILMAYVEMGRLHRGDEVIVPANTYIASFLAVSQAGLVPVPVDPDAVSMNITACGVESVLTPRVKAIMPVHLYGRVAWDEDLRVLVQKHGLLVVEDCAQALGAQSGSCGLFGTCMAGGLGDAAGISFYPTKNLGALGDGGIVVTHDEILARTVRSLANYGSTRRYHNEYIGLNSRLDPMQAAMLRVKLKYLDKVNHRRREIATAYDKGIGNPLVVKPPMPVKNGAECVWHQYVVRVPGCRDELQRFLASEGIGTDVHYPCAPHNQPCYAALEHGKLPVAESLAREVLSLPIGQYLTDGQIMEIVDKINQFKK